MVISVDFNKCKTFKDMYDFFYTPFFENGYPYKFGHNLDALRDVLLNEVDLSSLKELVTINIYNLKTFLKSLDNEEKEHILSLIDNLKNMFDDKDDLLSKYYKLNFVN